VKGLFLDSSGWFAAISPREKGHALARRAYEDAAREALPLVTTPLVVAEVHTLILRWRDPATAARFLAVALDPNAHVLHEVDSELIAAAMARWIFRYADQSFSLCDAVSVEVMRRARLTRCLTYDRHFSVAGYQILDELPRAR
jgi:predicted nucleic acid-binding protein